MNKIRKLIKRGIQLFQDDSLFRNSVFLMASTAVSSVLGFGFWLFVAHLYTPSEIGSASALISLTTLLGNISLLGLEASLVRFLPTSKNQSRDINMAALAVTGAAIAASTIYLFIHPLIGAPISLLDSSWEQIGFIVLMVIVSLNSLTDSIFIANRRAELHTMTYTLLATVKLILPLFLVPFGSMGIFTAYAVATLSSLALTYILMRRSVDYHILARPEWGMIRKSRKYATNNYFAHILSSASSQLMPMIIITSLGAAQVAYFAMAWTMANFLYVIPSAMGQSLLAEGATDPSKRKYHVAHAIRTLTLILVPTIAVSIVGAPFILAIFGPQYAANSTAIFQILAFATFFIAVDSVCNTVLNIEHRSSGVVAAELSGIAVTLGATAFLIRFGLSGIGVSLLLGNIAANLCQLIFFKFGLGKQTPSAVKLNIMEEDFQLLLRPYGITTFTVKPLARGATTHTFLITSGSESQVLRIYRDGSSRRDVAQEIGFMRFLAGRGLPIPAIIPSENGRYVSEYEFKDRITRPYVLMSFEEGRHPYRYSRSLIEEMASAQAAIHLSGIEFARSHSNTTKASSLRDRFLGRIAPKGFSHCDFDSTNVLVDDQKLSCILDFEGMRFAPLVSCLFFTLTKIYEAQGSLRDITHYLKKYQQKRQLSAFEKLIIRSALAKRYRRLQLLFTTF